MALITLQTIFQDAFPAYEQSHALPAHVRRAAHAIMQRIFTQAIFSYLIVNKRIKCYFLGES